MKNKNWFWGLFFIIAALVFIAYQFGFLGGINIFSLIITILLIPIIIKSCISLNFWGILFPIAIICVIFSDYLGISNIAPWHFFIVALLGSIGFSLIFGTPKHHNHHSSINSEDFSEIIDSPDGNNIEYKVSFSSGIKYVNTDNFSKGVFSCSFGSLKIYFDNCTPNSEGAVINLDASFSGVEIFIPKTWNIVNKLNASLSGVEEKNHRIGGDGPLVTLSGSASFSGIDIIYV